MPLTLLVGPANAGKVASLLDRYLASIGRNPFLVVPNRGEVERIERDLLRREGALLGGAIGTFDDLFRAIGSRMEGRRLVTPAQRAVMIGRAIASERLDRLAGSAATGGFASSLGETIAELAAGLVEPAEVEGELGRLYAAYVSELELRGLADREMMHRAAVGRLSGDLDAWHGRPVFVYGFEDLSGVQWALVAALAGRADVCASFPYEPGRLAFTDLERTATDLAQLAGERVEELRPRGWYSAPGLAHLERSLFAEGRVEPHGLAGEVRWIEGAGAKGVAESVGAEILGLLRAGTAAEDVAIVVPSLESYRAPVEAALGALGVPCTIEGPTRVSRTAFGRALLGLLRFAWLGGGRSDLYRYLRSPYSGLPREQVDWIEGRLRGRAVLRPERVEEETRRQLGQPLEALDELRQTASHTGSVRDLLRSMLRAAWGLARVPVDEAAAADLRVEQALRALMEELDAVAGPADELRADEVIGAIERLTLSTRPRREGRVAVLDLLRARTRRFEVVFVLGLEEGQLPRRATESPFLPDARRRELEQEKGHRRLRQSDSAARDRYLFYTACTRPWARLYLVRQAVGDDGRPLEPSPFWEETRSRFAPGDVGRATARRPLSALAWELHEAPTSRERLRSLAVLASRDEGQARAIAAALGAGRRIERALEAFSRPTRLLSRSVLADLGKVDRFGATELERFADCSSMWFVERYLRPRAIDPVVDARLRGNVAHQALRAFYAGLPRRFGVDTVDPRRLDEAIEYLRECLADAISSQVRLDLADVELLELEGTLARDLEQFVRTDVELGLPLVPRRFEVSFGTTRSAPEHQRGLDLGDFVVTGKIDRVDVDPFSATGVVQDYKSGEAFSASKIAAAGRLQVPLYVLALRELLGVEPLAGLYRSLSGDRETRGMIRAEAAASVPGLSTRDYLDEEEFWGTVDTAVETARDVVGRIRAGDVRHDPREGSCPRWCEQWPICRVGRL